MLGKTRRLAKGIKGFVSDVPLTGVHVIPSRLVAMIGEAPGPPPATHKEPFQAIVLPISPVKGFVVDTVQFNPSLLVTIEFALPVSKPTATHLIPFQARPRVLPEANGSVIAFVQLIPS
jgi:hypothetical protein